MYNVERRHKFPMSFWVGGSTCPAAVLPTQGGCIPSRTIKIKRLIFISTSITAANAANLIPTFLTPYNYIGAGVTNATIGTTLTTLLNTFVFKSPEVGVEIPALQTTDLTGYNDCKGALKIVTSKSIVAKSIQATDGTLLTTGGLLAQNEVVFWNTLACSGNYNVLFIGCDGQVYYPIKNCNVGTGLTAFADFSFYYEQGRDAATQVLTHSLTLTSTSDFSLVAPFTLSQIGATTLF